MDLNNIFQLNDPTDLVQNHDYFDDEQNTSDLESGN